MKITIDGIRIDIDQKKSILEIARERGIYIPSLCEYGRLVPFGGCRLCVVEIKAKKSIVPACGTLAEEGMEIVTTNRELQKMRRRILELLLSERPEAGRAPADEDGRLPSFRGERGDLRKVIEFLKPDPSAFPPLGRKFESETSDLFFDRNNNLCLLCGRCVRICSEVRGASALAFQSRGPETSVGAALGRPLLDSDCQFCGACVDVCPSGALREKNADRSVPLEKHVHSVCAFCAQGCRLTFGLKQGRIVRSIPSRTGAVNGGQACVKGRFLVGKAVYNKRRILKPLIRADGRLVECEWPEALRAAAERLSHRESRPVAFVSSAHDSCEDIYALEKFSRLGVKADRVLSAGGNSAQARLREFGRSQSLMLPVSFKVSDIGRAKTILIFSENPPATQPIIWLEVYRALRNGARLIFVGADDSGLKRYVSASIKTSSVRPWSLLMGLSKLLLDGSHASEESRLEGFLEFKNCLHNFQMTGALSDCGVSPEKLAKLAAVLDKKRPVAFLFGSEFGAGREGYLNLMSLWNLALQTQGILAPLAWESNARGGMEIAGALSGMGSGDHFPEGRNPLAGVRTLYSAGPWPEGFKKSSEFVIIQGIYRGDQSDAADLVLPQASFAETDGTFVNTEGRLQKFEKAIEPLGESKPGWQIISALARAMGLPDFSFQSSADVFRDMARHVPAFQDFDRDRLGPEAFIREGHMSRKRFVEAPASVAESAFPTLKAGPDDYRGLRMDLDIQELKMIRGR